MTSGITKLIESFCRVVTLILHVWEVAVSGLCQETNDSERHRSIPDFRRLIQENFRTLSQIRTRHRPSTYTVSEKDCTLFFYSFIFLGAQCVERGVSCTDCY